MAPNLPLCPTPTYFHACRTPTPYGSRGIPMLQWNYLYLSPSGGSGGEGGLFPREGSSPPGVADTPYLSPVEGWPRPWEKVFQSGGELTQRRGT